MTYYKNNGFFDRLERLSKWIDKEIDGLSYNYYAYGIMYFIPGFRKLTLISSWIPNYEEDLRELIADGEFYRDMYNREKYWWMAKK